MKRSLCFLLTFALLVCGLTVIPASATATAPTPNGFQLKIGDDGSVSNGVASNVYILSELNGVPTVGTDTESGNKYLQITDTENKALWISMKNEAVAGTQAGMFWKYYWNYQNGAANDLSFTWEFLVRLPAMNASDSFTNMFGYLAGTGGFGFRFGSSEGQFTFANGKTGNAYQGNELVTINFPMEANEWYHCVMTYDHTNKVVNAYVNGEAVKGADNKTDIAVDWFVGSHYLWSSKGMGIGINPERSAVAFDSDIGMFNFSEYSVDANEAAQLWAQAGKQWKLIPEESVETEIKAAVPELKEAITLHIQADVHTDSTEPVRMKFSFKGEDIWKEGVQSGTQYTFSLPDILPQDMGETISAELYIGDTLMDTLENYSMKQYCLNQLNSTDDAALKALLVALLNYGSEAQTYFGSTDTLVNDGLDQSILSNYLASKNYNASNPEGSVATPVSGENTGDYVWKAATLGLYDMVNIRVKFKASSVEDLKVVVNGTDVYTEFVELGNDLWHVYIPVYAGDFADTMTITFQNSTGTVGATLNYSVNTYVKYAMDNGSDAVKPLVESIYYYGALAAEMK